MIFLSRHMLFVIHSILWQLSYTTLGQHMDERFDNAILSHCIHGKLYLKISGLICDFT